MFKSLASAMVIGSILGAVSPALAGDSAKIPIKGAMKTFSAALNGCSNVVATPTDIGAGNVFVIKEMCWSLSGGTAYQVICGWGGPSGIYGLVGGANCRSFDTGFIVPDGAELNCTHSSCGTGNVSITGIIAKKAD